MNFKSLIYIAFRLFGGAVCAGKLILVSYNVQAQNLFVANEDGNTITEIMPGGVISAFASGLDTSVINLPL
jgi:hypothetical protein